MLTKLYSIATSPFRNWRYLVPYTKKIGYIGWLGQGNLGDEALYIAFQRLFAKYSVLPIMHNKKTQFLEKIKGDKLFVASFLGGGTLINRTSYLEILKQAQALYQPSFVLGAGVINPIFWDTQPGWENSFEEWIKVLNKCSFVGVRGPLSKEILVENGLNNVEITGDTALFFGTEKIKRKKGDKHIGINVGQMSGFLWGTEEKFLGFMVSFAKLMLDNGWRVTLLPVWDEDMECIDETVKQIGKPVGVFRNYLSVDATLDFLESCDLFVGVKLHSVILAMCVNTPSIMLEYRPKCLDFMMSMGLEKFNMRTDQLSMELLLNLIDELLENLEYYQEIIYKKTTYYRKLQEEKVKFICQVIDT